MMSEPTKPNGMPKTVPLKPRGATVQPIRFTGDDAALVVALKQKHPGAMEALYDRYAPLVQRVLIRVMGMDHNLSDMLQEVFIEAYSSIGSIKDGSRLQAWITSIAVFTARGRIRRRSRRRVFWVNDTGEVPDVPTAECSPEDREALRMTYQILESMPTDERIAFSLRFIEGMELEEIAESCKVSLSTIKRRINRAQGRFVAIAHRYPVLKSWIAQGDRWQVRG